MAIFLKFVRFVLKIDMTYNLGMETQNIYIYIHMYTVTRIRIKLNMYITQVNIDHHTSNGKSKKVHF